MNDLRMTCAHGEDDIFKKGVEQMKDRPGHNCCRPTLDASILNDVKKYLGPSIVYTVFDMDIIMNINAAFFVLFELGVGSEDEVFTISGNSELWSEFSENKSIISATKQYVYLKVKNVFDPPTSSYVLQAYESQIQELEWRLRELASGTFDKDEDESDKHCCHCRPCKPGGNTSDEEDPPPDDSESYTLPIASENTLGGVMIGDNVNIDEEGRISVNPEGVNIASDEEVSEVVDRIFT